MNETFFNICWALYIGTAFASIALMGTALNSCSTAQRNLVLHKLTAIIKKLSIASVTIEALVAHFQDESIEVIAIPDRVGKVREYRAYLVSGLLLAFALLCVVIFLEFLINTQSVPQETHKVSVFLCELNVFVVLLICAGSVFMFQRTSNWSELRWIVYPIERK